jgi:hypothetical protein
MTSCEDLHAQPNFTRNLLPLHLEIVNSTNNRENMSSSDPFDECPPVYTAEPPPAYTSTLAGEDNVKDVSNRPCESSFPPECLPEFNPTLNGDGLPIPENWNIFRVVDSAGNALPKYNILCEVVNTAAMERMDSFKAAIVRIHEAWPSRSTETIVLPPKCRNPSRSTVQHQVPLANIDEETLRQFLTYLLCAEYLTDQAREKPVEIIAQISPLAQSIAGLEARIHHFPPPSNSTMVSQRRLFYDFINIPAQKLGLAADIIILMLYRYYLHGEGALSHCVDRNLHGRRLAQKIWIDRQVVIPAIIQNDDTRRILWGKVDMLQRKHFTGSIGPRYEDLPPTKITVAWTVGYFCVHKPFTRVGQHEETKEKTKEKTKEEKKEECKPATEPVVEAVPVEVFPAAEVCLQRAIKRTEGPSDLLRRVWNDIRQSLFTWP